MSGEEGFLDDEVQDEYRETEVVEEELEEEEVIEADEGSAPVPTADNTLIEPAGNIDEVVQIYDQFEELKEKLLDRGDDLTEISGGWHVNKSGWRKIATAFNLSVETIDDQRIVQDGIVKFRVKARATAPNGKVATGVAMCASNESNHMDSLSKKDSSWSKSDDDCMKVDGKWRRLKDPREVNEHNIFATAATRAKNRAISDLVGGGEVSAEEMGKEDVF